MVIEAIYDQVFFYSREAMSRVAVIARIFDFIESIFMETFGYIDKEKTIWLAKEARSQKKERAGKAEIRKAQKNIYHDKK